MSGLPPVSPDPLMEIYGSTHRVYCSRWHMLAIFSFQSVVKYVSMHLIFFLVLANDCDVLHFVVLPFPNSATLWITFAPIAEPEATTYFGVRPMLINLLSIAFMVLYLPGSLFASYVSSKYGLRVVVVIAAIANLVSAAVRYLSCFLPVGSGAMKPRYAILMIGQCIGALAQPFLTNIPAKLAGAWFSPEEREVATVVAALSNPIGNALGQVLPTIFVSSTDNNPTVAAQIQGMDTLLLVELVASAVASAWALALFKDKPPTPPSHSASERDATRAANAEAEISTADEVKDEINKLLGDREFMKLVLGFGVGLGLFNAMLTVINQLVSPTGYSSDDAGVFGATLIGCGVLGAAGVGVFMDATHAYRTAVKGGFIACLVSMVFMLMMLRPNNMTPLTVAFALMGLTMMPLYPVTLEAAVECTYPIAEENSGGLLMLVGNVIGMVLTFVLGALLKKQETYTTVFTPSAIFMVAVIAFCCAIIVTFQGQYKRLESERAEKEGRSHSVDKRLLKRASSDSPKNSNRPLLVGHTESSTSGAM
jgi:MFS family permease